MLLERQVVLHYAFTDTDGNIAIKPKTQHNFKSIELEFLKISQTLQRDNAQNVAIGYNYGSSASEVMDAGMLSDLSNAGVEHPFPSDLQVSQRCSQWIHRHNWQYCSCTNSVQSARLLSILTHQYKYIYSK